MLDLATALHGNVGVVTAYHQVNRSRAEARPAPRYRDISGHVGCLRAGRDQPSTEPAHPHLATTTCSSSRCCGTRVARGDGVGSSSSIRAGNTDYTGACNRCKALVTERGRLSARSRSTAARRGFLRRRGRRRRYTHATSCADEAFVTHAVPEAPLVDNGSALRRTRRLVRRQRRAPQWLTSRTARRRRPLGVPVRERESGVSGGRDQAAHPAAGQSDGLLPPGVGDGAFPRASPGDAPASWRVKSGTCAPGTSSSSPASRPSTSSSAPATTVR